MLLKTKCVITSYFSIYLVEMKVFLMPNRERSYPGTIRIYESSDYSFVCISNSTDEIKDIQWSINGVQQKENVKIKNESNNHIYQLRSTLEYNPSSRHQTISCSSRGLNIIKEEKVNIKCKIIIYAYFSPPNLIRTCILTSLKTYIFFNLTYLLSMIIV